MFTFGFKFFDSYVTAKASLQSITQFENNHMNKMMETPSCMIEGLKPDFKTFSMSQRNANSDQ